MRRQNHRTEHSHRRLWVARFQTISTGKHDRLFLVLHSPRGLHIIEHVDKDAKGSGYSTAGKQTEATGGKVVVTAPAGALTRADAEHYTYKGKITGALINGKIEVATEAILKKLWLNRCPYVCFLPFASAGPSE